MLKKLFVAILLLHCAVCVFSQIKPRLGILPFTGGTDGDGETIATLFSIQPDILNAFDVVARTGAVEALVAERIFQMTGYTDSDTIAGLGRMLNADYVVSGHIRRLGNRNLVITTIVNVETFEQMAGDYRTYRKIEEIRSLLPAISQRMITASRRDFLRLPSLAVAPFNVSGSGVDVHDAETLAQILAIEIANTGKYAVLPRTSTMQAALAELEYQMSGYTADEGAKALGRAINAEYVLSAEVRSLGNINMFTAQILHTEDGRILAGGTREYRHIDDGIGLMAELAILLTDPANAHTQIAALNRQRSRAALFGNPARFWSLGASIGTSFSAPWVIGTVRGTLAPLRYSFFDIGIDFGFISGKADVPYYSLYPFIRYSLFIPFETSGGWYAGVGGGYMWGEFSFPEGKSTENLFAFDVTTGFNIGNFLDISYTLRTDFKTAGNKLAIGYTYRFGQRGKHEQ